MKKKLKKNSFKEKTIKERKKEYRRKKERRRSEEDWGERRGIGRPKRRRFGYGSLASMKTLLFALEVRALDSRGSSPFFEEDE